jgi:hypothetical protein
MDFIFARISRTDWTKFRDLCEAEQQRAMPDRKSRAQLCKDLVTRAHLSRSDRHNDPTFQVLLSLVAQALTEINAGTFNAQNVDELNPHRPKHLE